MEYNISIEISNINTITLLSGLGIVRSLRKYLGETIYIKWPNDIYYKSKKIAGILCEQLIRNSVSTLIIGIGINVNTVEFPQELDDCAVSMYNVLKQEIDLDELFVEVNATQIEILSHYNIPLSSLVLDEWRKVSLSIGREVSFVEGDNRVKGKIVDIDSNGALKVNDEYGTIHTVAHEVIYEIEQ